MTKKATESEAIENVRDTIHKLMKMTGHKAMGMPSKRVSFAFQNAISQIPDSIILHLIEQPDTKLRIQKLTSKPDDRPNAGSS